MKKIIKITALILSVVTVLSVGLTACKKETVADASAYEMTPIDISATYVPLVGMQNDWLDSNPDRGYRTEIAIQFYDTAQHNPELLSDPRGINVNNSDEEIRDSVERTVDIYTKTNTTLAIAYIGLHDCNELDVLPEKYFNALDIFLDHCKERGLRILWRHTYGLTTNKYIANVEDKIYLDKVCADQDIMIKHIKQFGEFLGKHTDVIHKISSGVIGNGEYTANFQWPPVDFNVVTDAIVRYMCVPNGLQYSIRVPRYKNNLLEWWKANHNGEEYPYADIIGFNNDASYGETDMKGAHSGCYQYNHSSVGCPAGGGCFNLAKNYIDEWTWVTETAAYTSQSGEMYTNNGLTVIKKIFPTGIDVIKQMAHHRNTTISNWHTMGETGGGANTADTNVMIRWKERETVTAEQLDSLGIIYDPNWFIGVDGKTMTRNPYDFIKDHLGYKLVAEKSNLKGDLGKLGKLKVDLTFKNYGFAAPFFLRSGFAVLDSKYNVVSSIDVGDPDKWISLPADYYVTERNSSVQNDIISYTIDAELTLPETEGKYYIAFYLMCDNGEGASLSNDLSFEKGYNILHTVEIK